MPAPVGVTGGHVQRKEPEIAMQNAVPHLLRLPIVEAKMLRSFSRGKDDYNLRLSDRRAVSAVQYLQAKGITGSRMTAKGYGESRLVNECSNNVPCAEAQHQLNRRTEIVILGVVK